MISQAGDIRVPTLRNIVTPNPPKYEHTPVEMFKKRTKRYSSLFYKFKDRKCWDSWGRSELDASNAQDVAQALDPDYCLTPPEGIELFQEKHEFTYFFDEFLQIDRGKKYTQEHEHDFNSQEIQKELLEFRTKSTNARLNATGTLSHVTSAKLDSWKGTAE